MFIEFTNQVFTESDVTKVTVSDNTDFSIDGTSKKIVFGLQSGNEYVDIDFDEIDLTDYEEICFHLYVQKKLGNDDLFVITVDGTDYTFKSFRNRGWNFVIVDARDLTTISNIRLTTLVSGIVYFIDYIGARVVNYDTMDIDILQALQNHISLDYDVSTTLSSSLVEGSKEISLTSSAYVYNTTRLQVTDGANTEIVNLVGDGELQEAIVNSYASGSAVTALCPVLLEEYEDIEPDPVCGIVMTDMATSKQDCMIKVSDGVVQKRFLGSIGITIYVDCSSKKKVLQMAREYQNKYGYRFAFLLDGEYVDIYLESESFLDDEIGNNPRMAWFYRVEPQPVTIATKVTIDTFNITIESEDV